MHLFLMAACAWLPVTDSRAATEPVDPEASAKRAQDLAWARAMNTDDHTIPAAFRAGHVTPRQLPDTVTSRSEGRFEIRLPSGAPITTPAVYGGRLYSSGGFKGKEFYLSQGRLRAPSFREGVKAVPLCFRVSAGSRCSS